MKTTRVQRRVFAISLCIILLVGFSFAQTGWVANGAGTRAAGMGYAFTGLADDASAVTWNPSGIAQLVRPEISAGFRTIFSSTNYDFAPYVGISQYTYDWTPTFEVNFASFIYPFKVESHTVAVGVSYRKLFSFIDTFKESFIGNFSGTEARYDNEDNYSGGVGAYAGTIGVQVTSFLLVGGTVNILTGTTTEKQKGVSGTTVNFDFQNEYSYSGTTFDLGVLVKKDWFSGGIAMNMPQSIKTNWKYSSPLYADFKIDSTYTLDLPLEWNFGVAVRPTDALTLAADYRIRPLSQTKLNEKTDTTSFFADANSFHIGAEYLIRLKDNFLPVRVGFYTEPLEFKDANNDQVMRYVVTAGVGFIVGPISFDASLGWYNLSYLQRQGETRKETQWRLNFGGVVHF